LVGSTFDQVFGEGAAEMYIPNVKEMRAKNAPVIKTYSLGTAEGQYLNIFVPLSEDTYLTSTMDVTEIKKAQKRAEELTNNLQRSNAELLQFAYVASHDLREPLRMITSYLGLLEQKYKGQLDAKAQEYIRFAVDGGERMQLLIDDLLAYSRVDTRAKAFTPVDMNKVVDGVIKVLEVPIRENKAEVRVQPLPIINADESQMFQLMQNLLDNAIKFHGKDAPVAQVRAVENGKEWTFAVKDNGIGMNLSQSDKIFQMFQRLHGPGEYPGTGIGLAIAKKIVERHNGRIWVESEPGNGSTFFFTIPTASQG
jgi:light-regulated signal transduction histidine kinase (bacteriophytochrome)